MDLVSEALIAMAIILAMAPKLVRLQVQANKLKIHSITAPTQQLLVSATQQYIQQNAVTIE